MQLKLFYPSTHFRKRADYGKGDSPVKFDEAYPEYLYQHKNMNYQPLMVPFFTK